jgi:hypothetical protein
VDSGLRGRAIISLGFWVGKYPIIVHSQNFKFLDSMYSLNIPRYKCKIYHPLLYKRETTNEK